MTITPPVRYSPGLETLLPDENKTISKLIETFDTILETTANDYGHAVPTVHAKAHGILKGTLNVTAGLPPELAQGLFSQPGTHDIYMRISTNAGDIRMEGRRNSFRHRRDDIGSTEGQLE